MKVFRPPLCVRRQRARLSCRGPRFDPWSGQVSCVLFFRGFSSSVRQMSGSFRPPRSPNIIWPSLSSIFIHYGRQWPEMLMRPKAAVCIRQSSSGDLRWRGCYPCKWMYLVSLRRSSPVPAIIAGGCLQIQQTWSIWDWVCVLSLCSVLCCLWQRPWHSDDHRLGEAWLRVLV